MILFSFSSFLFARPFKVATYNVQNLFDTHYNGNEYEAYIPHKNHNWTKRIVEIKLNRIAEVICDVDADIIALQEVENDFILKALFQRLDEVGCGYKDYAISQKKSAPIQVALLSRYRLKKYQDISVSSSSFVRNILHSSVRIESKEFHLFVNHWKSKAYHGVESKRIVSAKALQGYIKKMSRTSEYLILGDLNSDYNAYVSLEEKHNDTQGITAFNHILKTKINTRLVDEYDMKAGVQGVHYSLWNEIALKNRWSHTFYGKKSTLDHMVLPASLFDAKGIDYVNNSFRVFRSSYLFTRRGYIKSWKYKKGKHLGKGYSDHLPIYAYFDSVPYHYDRQKKRIKRKTQQIEDLYLVSSLLGEVLLKDVLVIFKRGNHALIKQSIDGKGILLFGCASRLEEGRVYDIVVQAVKDYHGLKEVTHAYVLNKKAKTPYKIYRKSLQTAGQNEMISETIGIYKNKYFYSDGYKIPIYFRNKKHTPSNGSILKIAYALIGYYQKKQLVIYSKKDFTILEK